MNFSLETVIFCFFITDLVRFSESGMILEPFGTSAGGKIAQAKEAFEINLNFKLAWHNQVSTFSVEIGHGCVECSSSCGERKMSSRNNFYAIHLADESYRCQRGQVFYRKTSVLNELSALSQQINSDISGSLNPFNGSNALIATWTNCSIAKEETSKLISNSNTFRFVSGLANDTSHFVFYNYDSLDLLNSQDFAYSGGFQFRKRKILFNASTSDSNVDQPRKFMFYIPTGREF